MKRLLLAVLLLAAVALPGSARADANRDQQCRDHARSMLAEKLGYTAEQIAVVTGCIQDAKGEWFWPESIYDSRVPSPVFNEGVMSGAASLWSALNKQIADFDAVLSAQYDAFNVAADAKKNLRISIDDLTDGGTSYGWGGPPELNNGGPGIKSASAYYANFLVQFANNPDHLAFSTYVRWWSERRYAAMPTGVNTMNPLAKSGYIDRMAFGRAPWPWEIKYALNVAQFLNWAYASNVMVDAPTPVPEPTKQSSTMAADCQSISAWVDQTQARWTEAFKVLPQGELPPSPGGSAARFRQNATTLRTLADEQEASNPPDEALAANALYVRSWRDIADAYDQMADALDAADQSAWDLGFQIMGEAYRDGGAAQQEITRLKGECQLGN